ncbi:amidohydrolase [Streptomyces sp. AV19]|nr:amidohydrolase family protein [Streptomyces sp. AV19]MBH1937577.1 amidohydrolase [Streptomyces sp. AV19]MDG4533592.1 amidohydrolase [Streptomyces sp. AV19]
MRIDTHAHYYPAAYLDLLTRFGSHDTDIARVPCAGDADGDVETRLRMMDEAGVDVQILSASPQLPHFEDRSHAVEAARTANDLYADLVRRHPDRFAAYAATPLPHADAAIAELGRALDDLGFVGAAITTTVLGRSLADPALEPFYAELDRRGAVLHIHPTGGGAASPLITDHGLTWVIGAPIEDTIAVLHLLRAGITAKYPGMKVHVAHLGGHLPFLMQRVEDNYRVWNAFPDSPARAAGRMWFDTANFHAPALRCAVDTFGPHNFLLGSDYPYFQDDLYTRAVTYVENAGLPPDTVRAVMADNAADLFGPDAITGRAR